jgi:hypothetical protein
MNTQHIDSAPLERPPFTWPLFVVQLWLLVAFVGMSAVLFAAEAFIPGARAAAASALAVGTLGAAVAVYACRNIMHRLDRAAPVDDLQKRLLLAPHR